MRRDETAKKIGRSRVTSNEQKTEEAAAIAFVPKKKNDTMFHFFLLGMLCTKKGK